MKYTLATRDQFSGSVQLCENDFGLSNSTAYERAAGNQMIDFAAPSGHFSAIGAKNCFDPD